MRQTGFTIVELVVVMVLFGILVATTLPRFMDIDDDAHQAAFEDVLGRLQGGVALYHATATATGTAANGIPPPDDFAGLRSNADGYPYGSDDNSGSGSDVADSDDCGAVFRNLQQATAPTVTNSSTQANVSSDGAGFHYTAVFDAGDCVYYYTAEALTGTVRTMTYDPATGQVSAGTATL